MSTFRRTNGTFTGTLNLDRNFVQRMPDHKFPCPHTVLRMKKNRRKKTLQKVHARFVAGWHLHQYTCTCAGTFLKKEGGGRLPQGGRLPRTLRYMFLPVSQAATFKVHMSTKRIDSFHLMTIFVKDFSGSTRTHARTHTHTHTHTHRHTHTHI